MSGRVNNNLLVALTSSVLLTSILALYLHHRKKKSSTNRPVVRRISSTEQAPHLDLPQESPESPINKSIENGFHPRSGRNLIELGLEEPQSKEVKQNGSITQAGKVVSKPHTTKQSVEEVFSESAASISLDLSGPCRQQEQQSQLIRSKSETVDSSETRLQSQFVDKSLKVIYSSLVPSPDIVESEVQTQEKENTMQIKEEATHAEPTAMDSSETNNTNGTNDDFKKLECSSLDLMDESSNDSAMELSSKIEKTLVIESPIPSAPTSTTKKSKKKKQSKTSGETSQSKVTDNRKTDSPQPESRSRVCHASGDSALAASPDLVEEDLSKDVKERKPLLDSPLSSQVSTDIGSPVYSDSHSEGSTDSGKPNSSALTSQTNSPSTAQPSTPSDVHRLYPHGTHSPHLHGPSYAIIYQFELPSDLVGRLIGKKGIVIQNIKAKSRASVMVHLHPFAQDLRLITIEGSRKNIQNALDMIRNLFPVSTYPEVTMHQIYFPDQMSNLPTQVILPTGSSIDVILSSMISAGHFFLQSPAEPSYQHLSMLDSAMNRSYSDFETPHITVAASGMIVAAPIMGGWFRAIVTDVPKPGQVICKFVDYGGYSLLDLKALRQIRMDFMSLPFQASECYLSDIAPIEGNQWTTKTSVFFEQQVLGCLLKASVTGYTSDGCTLIRLYKQEKNETVFINELLVQHGFAKWISGHPNEQETETSASVKPSFASVTKVEARLPVTDDATFPELSSS